MKKIITTLLVAGSLLSLFGSSALFAEDNQNVAINQKAKVMAEQAKARGDKLIEEAKVKAKALIEKAKVATLTLKEESAQGFKQTTSEAKALANEALQKAKTKSKELALKVKTVPQYVKHGINNEYVYSKELVNESFEKSKDAANDLRIHAAISYAFLISPDIPSMRIDVDVKDGIVDLFGKVKSDKEAEQATLIALLTSGVRAVNSFFVVRD
jgi:osmotically-inducible protein OsmY